MLENWRWIFRDKDLNAWNTFSTNVLHSLLKVCMLPESQLLLVGLLEPSAWTKIDVFHPTLIAQLAAIRLKVDRMALFMLKVLNSSGLTLTKFVQNGCGSAAWKFLSLRSNSSIATSFSPKLIVDVNVKTVHKFHYGKHKRSIFSFKLIKGPKRKIRITNSKLNKIFYGLGDLLSIRLQGVNIRSDGWWKTIHITKPSIT